MRARSVAALVGLAIVAATGCAVHDPVAAPARPLVPTAPSTVMGAPASTTTAHGSVGTAGSTTAGATTKTRTSSSAAGSAKPAQPVNAADSSPTAALLAPADVGPDWQRLQFSQPAPDSSQHQYCAGEFASDRAIQADAQTSLIRHTDELRIEEEATSYSGKAAVTALGEYRHAFAQCRDYSTGSGPDALAIHIDPASAPAYGDEAVAAAMTLTKGTMVVHARIVVMRRGALVLLVSVLCDNAQAVTSSADQLDAVAARHAAMTA